MVIPQRLRPLSPHRESGCGDLSDVSLDCVALLVSDVWIVNRDTRRMI